MEIKIGCLYQNIGSSGLDSIFLQPLLQAAVQVAPLSAVSSRRKKAGEQKALALFQSASAMPSLKERGHLPFRPRESPFQQAPPVIFVCIFVSIGLPTSGWRPSVCR